MPIDAAYHQLITNEFRTHVTYGAPKPGPEEVKAIMKAVYAKYPLPTGK
ncbi:MAG: hypothetical protein KF819_18845 [Labilithrix sp.]|nr:hypothetical protein [Labilithrix sp.]